MFLLQGQNFAINPIWIHVIAKHKKARAPAELSVSTALILLKDWTELYLNLQEIFSEQA